MICRRGNLEQGSRIGANVGIYIMDPKKQSTLTQLMTGCWQKTVWERER